MGFNSNINTEHIIWQLSPVHSNRTQSDELRYVFESSAKFRPCHEMLFEWHLPMNALRNRKNLLLFPIWCETRKFIASSFKNLLKTFYFDGINTFKYAIQRIGFNSCAFVKNQRNSVNKFQQMCKLWDFLKKIKEIIRYKRLDLPRFLYIGERFKHKIVAEDGFHQLPKQNK